MKELILLALHAAPSALNEAAINRQVRRALKAGASESDIADVLVTIIPLANHPLYTGIPILMEELRDAGLEAECVAPEMSDGVRALKDDFIARRGYWTEKRDMIGRWMPDYFNSFINACMEPWRSGSLTPLERELMYIAIDCSITHTYEAGLRMHIQNALRYGATRDQILEVFQLAGLLGTEGYVLGIECVRGQALSFR
jgi:alkylhydroperoxidase/carboxymuconolactone decarboxylase family protein YurZ